MGSMSKHRCVDCGSLNTAQVVEAPDVNKYRGGRVPWGFVVMEGKFQFCPETGPLLAWVLTVRSSGWTYRRIAQELNVPSGWEAPSGGQWSHGSVRRVIAQGKKLSHLIPLSYIM